MEEIKEISEQFIGFVCKKGLEISEEEAVTWFMDTYALDDIELGKDICSSILMCMELLFYLLFPRTAKTSR